MPEDDAKRPEVPAPPRPTYIPRPPSRADLDQISRDQALITDEWAGDPPREREKRERTREGG